MNAYLHHVQPVISRCDNVIHGHRINVAKDERAGAFADLISSNWSGVEIRDPARKISNIHGQWTIPGTDEATLQLGLGSHVVAWVGIDGDDKAAALVQGGHHFYTELVDPINYIVYGYQYLWFEWLPDNEMRIDSVPCYGGDIIYYVLTVVDQTHVNFLVQNVSQNTSTSFQATAPTGGALSQVCGEWIVERPMVNGTLTELYPYGQIVFQGYASNGDLPGSGLTIDMVENNKTISAGSFPDRYSVKCVYTGPLIRQARD